MFQEACFLIRFPSPSSRFLFWLRPYPEAVFDVNFYRKNPQPFCSLAKEIWPGMIHSPTLTHSFISLLASKQKLLRVYTQNIDGLEVLAELPPEKIVECHGHFRSASCIDCKTPADIQHVTASIVEEAKAPVCKKCEGEFARCFFETVFSWLFLLSISMVPSYQCLVLHALLQDMLSPTLYFLGRDYRRGFTHFFGMI